jgi:hypothetical protein
MKTLIALIALSVAGCSSAPNIASDLARIPDGRYVQDPKKGWYAGTTIDVRGDKFSSQAFTDVLREKAIEPVTGTIRKDGTRYFFMHSGEISSVWILARSRGKPALWSEEGFDRWKESKEVAPQDVLYLEEMKPNQSPQPTPPSRRG